MNSIEGTMIVALLFVLRFAFPLVLTLIFGMAMNRLIEGGRIRPKL